MKITEVQEILHAQLVTDLVEDFDVEFGYGCDLMSDVRPLCSTMISF